MDAVAPAAFTRIRAVSSPQPASPIAVIIVWTVIPQARPPHVTIVTPHLRVGSRMERWVLSVRCKPPQPAIFLK